MNIKYIFHLSLFVLSVICLTSCETRTEKHFTKQTMKLNDKYQLEIWKENIEETTIGIISGHNYGTVHYFGYAFNLNPGDISWEQPTAEPKNLIICPDVIYLHYMQKKLEAMNDTEDKPDNIKDSKERKKYEYKIRNFYAQYIDKRYFFRLLGNAYWLNISSTEYYANRKGCERHSVLNDNEFET